jgi:hypothetical protein
MMPDGPATPNSNQWQLIAGIEKSQIQISSALASIIDRLESVEKKVSDASNIPWGAISASSTIIIAILGGFIALLAVLGSTSVSNLDGKLETLAVLVSSHQQGGHPGSGESAEKLNAISQNVSRIEQSMTLFVPRAEHTIRDTFVSKRFEDDEKRVDKHEATAIRERAAFGAELNKRFDEARASLARSDDQLFHRIERIEDYILERSDSE